VENDQFSLYIKKIAGPFLSNAAHQIGLIPCPGAQVCNKQQRLRGRLKLQEHAARLFAKVILS